MLLALNVGPVGHYWRPARTEPHRGSCLGFLQLICRADPRPVLGEPRAHLLIPGTELLWCHRIERDRVFIDLTSTLTVEQHARQLDNSRTQPAACLPARRRGRPSGRGISRSE